MYDKLWVYPRYVVFLMYPYFDYSNCCLRYTLYSWITRYTPILYVDRCTQYMLICDVPILCIVIGLIWYTSIMYDFYYTCYTSHHHPAAILHILGIPSNHIGTTTVWIVTPQRLSWMSIVGVLVGDNLFFSQLTKLYYFVCILPSELALRLLPGWQNNLCNIPPPAITCSIRRNTPALEHWKI